MSALKPLPADARARDLWLQHAAGWIVFRDVRQRALSRIDPQLPEAAQTAARQAVDDTVYALMQCMDGVSGQVDGPNFSLALHTHIALLDESGNETQALDLRDGDGMCMGFHGWVDGDFGDDLLASRPANETDGP